MSAARICFVCNEYPPGPHGGIGTMTQVLGRALVRANHHVRVIGLHHASWPALDYEEDEGVQVWRLRWTPGRIGWLWSRYRLFKAISEWVNAGEIDIVEIPDWEGMAAGWPALDVPVVARAHGSNYYFNRELGRPTGCAIWFAERASLRRADFWCSVSQYLGRRTQSIFGLASAPMAILYNGVNIPPHSSDRRQPRSAVFSGTLTAKKGIISLVKAWRLVRGKFPDAHLDIFGKDTAHNGSSMRAFLASLLGWDQDGVVFHDQVTNTEVLEALNRANVAVFPSYAEGMGIAPLEAMACGCATIFGRCGTADELMRHGQDGLLVDPDSPEDIAEEIGRLFADDRLTRRLGNAGRSRVEKEFSVAALVASNSAFYDNCIELFHERRAS